MAVQYIKQGWSHKDAIEATLITSGENCQSMTVVFYWNSTQNDVLVQLHEEYPGAINYPVCTFGGQASPKTLKKEYKTV